MPPAAPLLRYGAHEAQSVQCHNPLPDAGIRGVAALLHGGYWRERFDASLMEPMGTDLIAHGWAVANIEYRRGAAGAWPRTLEDVRAALVAVVASDWFQGMSGPLVGVGHSVGGQLALLAADLLDGVVALAPVTDIIRTHRERLGDDAVAEYFGADPDAAPQVLADASPVRNLPLGAPTLVVHGAADQRVPVQHSIDFVSAARTAGDQVDFHSPHGLDHLAAIDPRSRAWAMVREWMVRAATQSP